MAVEVGSRARLHDGRPCIVTERAYWLDAWHWRVVARDGWGRWTGWLVSEAALRDVTPPPVFDVGDRVRTRAGRTGVVVRVAERDGRMMYGLEVPRTTRNGRTLSSGVAWHGVEQIVGLMAERKTNEGRN